MSIFSRNAFTFAIAAAAVGVASLTSFEASAFPLKPGVSPMPGKFGQPSGGCPGGLVGCTPNTYTPGKSSGGNSQHINWGHVGLGALGVGLAVNAAQQQPAIDGDCYYVRRRVMTDIGVIVKRRLVCD